MLENQLVPITSGNLAYEDQDSAADMIYYIITKPLGEGQGTLEHVERPFKRVRQFTQEDVNNNRIIYRPPEREIGNREMEFTFYFTGMVFDLRGLHTHSVFSAIFDQGNVYCDFLLIIGLDKSGYQVNSFLISR